MSKKLLKMFHGRDGDVARMALWAAINVWCERRGDEDAMVVVEEAAKAFGRKRSRTCKEGHHAACEDESCECRCHYTRRKSRFRPLRGQSEQAKAARLARGLCPTHGVVLVPETVKWAKGAPVADILKCSRKDCTFTVEANHREEGT